MLPQDHIAYQTHSPQHPSASSQNSKAQLHTQATPSKQNTSPAQKIQTSYSPCPSNTSLAFPQPYPKAYTSLKVHTPKLVLPPKLSNCYTTSLPSMTLPLGHLVLVFPWHLSIPKEFSQHILPNAQHQKRWVSRALNQIQQSHFPQWPVTQLPAATPLPVEPAPLHQQES